MSVNRSQLAAGVYSLCDGAADEPLPDGLPLHLVLETLADIESEMLRDLDLSDQSRRVNRVPVTLSGTGFTVNRSDYHAPAYAFFRTSSDSEWYPVEIINHAGIRQAGIDGRPAIAFHGTPQQAETSWEAETGHELELWYERAGSDAPAMNESTEIGGLYDSYLKLQAAAQCRELMGKSVDKVLVARLTKGEKQWQKYANRARSQGVAAKTPVYTPPRFRRGSTPRFQRPSGGWL